MNKARRWKRAKAPRRDRTRERIDRRRAAESAASAQRAAEYFAESLGISVERLRSQWRRVQIGMASVPMPPPA